MANLEPQDLRINSPCVKCSGCLRSEEVLSFSQLTCLKFVQSLEEKKLVRVTFYLLGVVNAAGLFGCQNKGDGEFRIGHLPAGIGKF